MISKACVAAASSSPLWHCSLKRPQHETATEEQLDGGAVMLGPLPLHMTLTLAVNLQEEMHVWGLWRSEDNSVESVPSVYLYSSSWEQTQSQQGSAIAFTAKSSC